MVLIVFIWMQIRFYDDLVIIAHDSCYCFDMFYMMLRRNILYTAITRAKEKIVIVGSKKALYQAIHNTACDKRNTRLGERIVREYNALLTKKASAWQ